MRVLFFTIFALFFFCGLTMGDKCQQRGMNCGKNGEKEFGDCCSGLQCSTTNVGKFNPNVCRNDADEAKAQSLDEFDRFGDGDFYEVKSSEY